MEKLQRHFEEQLDILSEKILVMGGLVEEAIGRTLTALVERDSDLARTVIRDDARVDRLELEIDELCTAILGLQAPLARDLRFVTTAMKITTDLERIADLAVNVSERALELNEEPQLKPFIDIPVMARHAQAMVRGALDAFVQRDAAAARAVIALDDSLDDRMEQVFRELLSFMIEDQRTITRALRLVFIAKSLERIGDQATNICEQVVYMAEGRVIKHPYLASTGSQDEPSP
jgi:phosphate transport system protein